MDPFSHAIVGATAATLTAKKKEHIKIAALVGAIAGMSSDLDVLIKQVDNPMFGVAFHRHFTHALPFAPILAALISLAFWPFLKRSLPFLPLYIFALAGVLFHGPLDSSTNYGTHLFWPFTERRENWNLISIIDPIFTITAMFFLILAIKKKSRKFVVLGEIFILSYLAFGFAQKQLATRELMMLAAERGHVVERVEVKPSFANLIVWRGQYLHQGRVYADAYRISFFSPSIRYEGSSVPLYIPEKIASEKQQRDLEYFTFFSDGWVARAPTDANIIADMRFSILPNSIAPLWGIRFQPENPEKHVLFENLRSRTPGDFAKLWGMIMASKP